MSGQKEGASKRIHTFADVVLGVAMFGTYWMRLPPEQIACIPLCPLQFSIPALFVVFGFVGSWMWRFVWTSHPPDTALRRACASSTSSQVPPASVTLASQAVRRSK